MFTLHDRMKSKIFTEQVTSSSSLSSAKSKRKKLKSVIQPPIKQGSIQKTLKRTYSNFISYSTMITRNLRNRMNFIQKKMHFLRELQYLTSNKRSRPICRSQSEITGYR